GQAGGGKGREKCGRAGEGEDWDLASRAKRDEAETGAAHKGHDAVADKGVLASSLHGTDEFGGRGHSVVAAMAAHWLCAAALGAQVVRVARVFGGDLVRLFEDAEGTESDVLEITDRCTHQVEAAA